MPFRTQHIEFNQKNLEALRFPRALLLNQDVEQQPVEHLRDARLRDYEGETTYERAVRWLPLIGLVLAVGFIGCVTVLLTIASLRMSDALNNLDGDTIALKIEKLVDYGVESAKNVHQASSNVVAMTVLASHTAAVAAPQLAHAVNDSVALVDDLRSWSFHPSLAIAPGHSG